MKVTNHQRVDENQTTTILKSDPMFGVLQGSARRRDFVKHDWEEVYHEDITIHHFHRGFGNSQLTVELCEMEINGILHAMEKFNRLQAIAQSQLRSGETVFEWSGWMLAAVMESMYPSTDYLREIRHHFQNCIGRDLYLLYVGLNDESNCCNA